MPEPQLFPPYDAERVQRALDDWSWLLGEGPHSIFAVSASGNVVIQDEDDGLWVLDTWWGCFDPIADSEEEFHEAVRDRDTADEWFLASLVTSCHERFGPPDSGRCYGWKIPPMLSGELSLDNTELNDLFTQISMAGQIAEQCKDLPPGTRIDGVRIEPG